jgi:hypothetical protein
MEIIIKDQVYPSEIKFTECGENPNNVTMIIDDQVFSLNLKELEAVVIAFNKVNEL